MLLVFICFSKKKRKRRKKERKKKRCPKVGHCVQSQERRKSQKVGQA